ncbi:DNA polymerase I [Inquilinus sp. CAU 1745]|uniref:DNA polymerase I n=1 Tax=Inquilinus sp. CAU 1745 TaxID=3140369 RepID=UPI00325A7850
MTETNAPAPAAPALAGAETAPLETGPAAGPRTYYLVDGSGFIFRAFHALPMMNRRSDGVPVNAVYGYANMLLKLLADIKADHVAVVFDASRENFRNAIYADYKANRAEPPEELIPQFPLIREATLAFELPMVEKEGYEADDLIATYCRLAKEEGSKVVIVSSDKDLMQLVGDGVTMLDPIKNKVIDEAEVVEKFGLPPKCVVDIQALAGDPVDNVPGVPGIGVKTAAQLISDYGDLDSLLARAHEIKQPKRRESLIQYADQARISRDLVRLDAHVDAPLGLDGMIVDPPDRTRLVAFLEAQGFRSITARVQAELDGTADTPPTPAIDPAPVVAPGEGSYELVQDEESLKAWIDRAVEAGTVAFDTETNSLDAAICDLVGVSLSVTPGEACYIPICHVGAESQGALALDGEAAAQPAPKQIPLERVVALLKPLLEDPSVLKVGHNLKYDYLVLARHGVDTQPVDDTMLLSYVLDGGAHGHGMDELAQLHLGHKTISFSELCGTGKKQITFDRVPLDKALAYAAEDADVTLRLHRLLKPRLLAERMTTVYETIERPLARIVGRMEFEGVRIDRQVLAGLSAEFAGRLAALETEIHGLAGRPFNVGSPKQLGEVLFDEMSIQGGKKGKTGAYATGSEILEPLAVQGIEIARKVLDWRQLSKLKGTYTDALQTQINPKTGRVHTSFSLAATNTGRLSSNDPNLQNIPIRTEEGRKIRYAFVAEEGCKLISVDYSQIELRLVAEIAGIGALKQAFHDGTDIHALTASQVFGVPLAEMTGETRRKAKAINFGIIYGISAFGLANQLGIPQSEASVFIKAYLEKFSELKVWMDETRRTAREKGFVTTLFGRKCHVPGIKDPNPARRGFAERQAINAPIQGTAADIIKRAMARLPDALEEAGLKARMLLQVHDELVFEAPEAEAEKTAEIARRVMEASATLGVPLVAEAGIGDNWAAAH